MSSWTCLHTHVLVFWWFIAYPMAVLIRSQADLSALLFPRGWNCISKKLDIFFESSKAQPPTFTVFCPSEFRKDLHGGNVPYATQWGRKFLDAQQCHTVVLRSWCLTVCWELDQRIGCMLCDHIQILEVHHLCSRVLSHLPFLAPHNSSCFHSEPCEHTNTPSWWSPTFCPSTQCFHSQSTKGSIRGRLFSISSVGSVTSHPFSGIPYFLVFTQHLMETLWSLENPFHWTSTCWWFSLVHKVIMKTNNWKCSRANERTETDPEFSEVIMLVTGKGGWESRFSAAG